MSIFWIKQPEQGVGQTGKASPRPEWDDGPDGKKGRTDRLARDEATGFPLWQVKVTDTRVAYGRASLVTAKMQVPRRSEPVRMVEYWRADGMAGTAATRPAGAGGRGRVEGESSS